MKSLFISTTDIEGGANRATHWLAKGLRKKGLDLSMLVYRKTGNDYWVQPLNKKKIAKFSNYLIHTIDSLPFKMYKKRDAQVVWSMNLLPTINLMSRINDLDPDIINLHWVGAGFFPISAILKVKKPIVWSLYDMWPFTGGCHYDNFCGRYVDSCGNCPQLNSKAKDITSFLHARKLLWKNTPITIVTPSNDLANEARRSSLFKDYRIEVIPHGTDLKVFKPVKKSVAREILCLNQDKRYILFGAMNDTSDPRKGFHLLKTALIKLSESTGYEDVSLLIFGANEPEKPQQLGFSTHYIGRLHDDASLALLYSAADVTVTPSIQEAFGMTASESMACGTPVVAFGATGPLDVIDHKVDGYLAKPFCPEDFCEGIKWLLDKSKVDIISSKAREKCQNKFNLEHVSEQYKLLYEDILKQYRL
jgi:glycosyltransferase involved in cell wall biosynthesis